MVTRLNSSNDKKIERIMESNIIKFENTDMRYERDHYRLIIDEIYAFERVQAAKACSKLNKSVGFAYIINCYKDFERSLHYFSYKISDELLFIDGNIEFDAHEKFASAEEFEQCGPVTFLTNYIAEKDEDLANYIRVNIEEADYMDRYIDYIKSNWKGYNFLTNASLNGIFERACEEYDQMITGRTCNYTKPEILIHLSLKHGVISNFKESYIMEDTSEEELNKLIESNDIDEENCSEHDKEIISKMDEHFKEFNNRKLILKSVMRPF